MEQETFSGFLDSRLVAFAPARFARNDRGGEHRYGPAKARALIRTVSTQHSAISAQAMHSRGRLCHTGDVVPAISTWRCIGSILGPTRFPGSLSREWVLEGPLPFGFAQGSGFAERQYKSLKTLVAIGIPREARD